MKRTVWITCAVIMLAVGVAGWWGLRRTAEPAVANGPEANTQPAKVATAAGETPEDAQSRKESDAASELLLSLAKIFAERPSVAPIEKILRESNDPVARKNALTDLLNVRYERAEAIQVLNQALSDSSPGVRVWAAELLYILGSSGGRGALFEVIRSGIQPETTHLSESVNAARILTRFREAIPTDLLLQLYEQHPHPGLLETMAMQGDVHYFPFLLEALAESPMAGNLLNLGRLGAPEAFSVAKEIFDSTANERNKVAAALGSAKSDQIPIDRTALNTWEDSRVVDLVKKSGRRRIIFAALWTEICLAFPAIHAMGDGYDVYVVTDASGGVSVEAHERAIQRMVQAGAVPMTWMAVVSEWQRDWAREATVPALAEILFAHGGSTGTSLAWELQLRGSGPKR